jgi:hypothetical protein
VYRNIRQSAFNYCDWYKIYLRPLGEFPKGQIFLLDRLREYAASYFALEIEVLPCLEKIAIF